MRSRYYCENALYLGYTRLLYPLLHNVIQPTEKENVKKWLKLCFDFSGSMAFSTLENLGTWEHPSCGSAPHLIQSSHVVSGQPVNGVFIRWSCAEQHGDGGLRPRQHKMTTMTTESWIVREFVKNFINFGSIYLSSVNNLKGQCKFNIRRFRFFRVDGGGHPQALGLHIACCRLPRRHDGRLLPSLGLVRIPQKNSPLSDFPAPHSKGFSCPSSPLTNPLSFTHSQRWNKDLCSQPLPEKFWLFVCTGMGSQSVMFHTRFHSEPKQLNNLSQ